MEPRARLLNLRSLIGFFALAVPFMLLVFVLPLQVVLPVLHEEVRRDVAIAAYSGQIQVFAVLTVVGPLLLILAEYLQPKKVSRRFAAVMAALAILFSLEGMIITIKSLVMERFDYLSIVWSTFLALQSGVIFVYMVLIFGGCLNLSSLG